MKKFLPYILIISFLVNTFAPISILFNQGKVVVEKKVVEAYKEDGKGTIRQEQSTTTVNSITIVGLIYETESKKVKTLDLQINDKKGDKSYSVNPKTEDCESGNCVLYSHTFKDLSPATTYYFQISITYEDGTTALLPKDDSNIYTANTLAKGENGEGERVYGDTNEPPSYGCGVGWFGSDNSVAGCVAQLGLLVYRITAYLFATAGMFFDFTFGYSVNDTSYRMSFITNGWALVRDFVNIFFIFILLYAAISIILGLGNGNGKKIIINVIIVGLLINFSLFATQLIVDTSNILARVFYNHIVIEQTNVTDKAGTVFENKVNNKYKSLSAGLVNKINPQRLVNNANEIELKKVSSSDNTKNNGIGVGAYILVIILAIIINIIGMFVFLNVGLIFLARVIGLALAMIFAPIAFFSYTVPGLKKIKTVGADYWLPETLKLAFLAPVFIFFLYLIIQFVDSGMGLFDATKNLKGVLLVLSMIIPFAFIMILLKKASAIASDLSGEMGRAVTKGIKTVAGAAVGGALGGVALAGRAGVGRLATMADNSKWLNRMAAGQKMGADGKMVPTGNAFSKGLGKFMKKSATKGSKGGFDLRQTGLGNVISKQTGLDLDKYTKTVGLGTSSGLGGFAGKQQKKIEKDEKFAESLNLGYDKQKYQKVENDIKDMETSLANLRVDESNPYGDHNTAKFKQEVDRREKEIADTKKDRERIKTGLGLEYMESVRKKSGRIVKKGYDTKRDQYGNIERFAQYDLSKRSGKQFLKTMMEGFIKGMSTGAGIGIFAGGASGILVGGVIGGLIGTVRQISKYRGATNREVGEKLNVKVEVKNKYIAPNKKEEGEHSTTHTNTTHNEKTSSNTTHH